MKLAIIFRRFGPYHLARLAAAGARGPVTGIELNRTDGTYAWDVREGGQGFDRVTVLEDRPVAGLPRREMARLIHEVLDRVSPDVVAAPGWAAPWSLAAIDWCDLRRRPAILMSESARMDGSSGRLGDVVKSRLVKSFQAALVAGKPHRDYLAELGFASERVFDGYDVVDNRHFREGAAAARRSGEAVRADLGAPRQYFLASGRFVPKKNAIAVVDAYSRYVAAAGESAWDLVMLGDGPLRSRIEKHVAGLGLGGRVVFPGFRQYDELPAWYALAGAFVHASLVEQWGLVVNEAMAAGLPVLVSNRCGCAADLVWDGINGFVFDPTSVPEMAGAMLRVAGGAVDGAAMAEAGLGIIGRWTTERFADSIWRAATVACAQKVGGSWLDRRLRGALGFVPMRADAGGFV
ncbi:MAG: glycosyltransferase [Lentisphaerae bacterium]|nr:glycosyltransferase [Lentisphaerota bacterium]